MKKLYKLIPFTLFIILSATAAFSAVPRFLFIPVANATGNDAYDYISPSVTDDLRKKIKQQFAVRELDDKEWRKLARDNFFQYEDEYHTRTAALQIGIILQRDVVLSGCYRLKPSKRNGLDVLVFDIYLISVKDRKIISQVTFEAVADGSMFGRMEKLRDKIIVELAKILPNRSEADRVYYEDPVFFKNQLLVSGGTTFAITPSSQDMIPAEGSFSFMPTDFPLVPNLSLQYRRLNVFYEGIIFSMDATSAFGTRDIYISDKSNRVSAMVVSLYATPGIGYRFPLWKGFYLLPQAGAGGYYGYINVDMNISGKEVVDPVTGAKIESQAFEMYGLAGRFDLSAGYGITSNLALEIGGGCRYFYGTGGTSADARVFASVVLGF